jgi:hypothetical protein
MIPAVKRRKIPPSEVMFYRNPPQGIGQCERRMEKGFFQGKMDSKVKDWGRRGR